MQPDTLRPTKAMNCTSAKKLWKSVMALTMLSARRNTLDDNLLLKGCSVLHHKLLEQFHPLALARVVVALIVAVDADLRAALLAHWRRSLEELFWVLDIFRPCLR